jgi:hypothetical protein
VRIAFGGEYVVKDGRCSTKKKLAAHLKHSNDLMQIYSLCSFAIPTKAVGQVDLFLDERFD